MFQLKYYGGFSIFESYNIPVPIRRWFLTRLGDQIKKEAEQVQKSKKPKK
jgi:hypothetical protein